MYKLTSKPNTKTKSLSFDLPAVKTCPGKTNLCSTKCYALQLEKMYSNVKFKYQRNLIQSRNKHFVEKICEEIPSVGLFRIHVSGDFYSNVYIRKWIKIATQKPNVKFYCYSRSWRVPTLKTTLFKFGELPNVTLNLSCDLETGKPNNEKFRWAFMSTDDTAPDYLRSTDIVFRTNKLKKDVVHRINSIRVCPLERGRTINLSITCATCLICVKKYETIS